MTPYLKALASGYSTKQILKHLAKSSPSLFSRISKASNSNYSDDEIVNHMSNSYAAKNRIDGFTTPRELYDIQQDKEKQRIAQLAQVAGGVLGGLLMSKMLSRGASAAAGAASSGGGEAPLPNTTAPAAPIPKSAAKGAPPIPTPEAAETPIASQVNPAEIFKKFKVDDYIKDLSSLSNRKGEKNTPEGIAYALKSIKLSDEQKKELKSITNEPLESLVSRFLEQGDSTEQMGVDQEQLEGAQDSLQSQEPEVPGIEGTETQQETQLPPGIINDQVNNIQNEEQLQEENEVEIEKQKKVKKKPGEGVEVRLSDGSIGKIVSIKNGIAKIDVDGEERHRKIDELEEPLIEKEKLGQMYDEMIAEIPDDKRSSHIMWTGYDPEKKELFYIPHDGSDLYRYVNIPDKIREEIDLALGINKTSGENKYHAWEKGKSGRGAVISQLIKKLEKENPGESVHAQKVRQTYSIFEEPKASAKRNEQMDKKVKAVRTLKEREKKNAEKRAEKERKKLSKRKQK